MVVGGLSGGIRYKEGTSYEIIVQQETKVTLAWEQMVRSGCHSIYMWKAGQQDLLMDQVWDRAKRS